MLTELDSQLPIPRSTLAELVSQYRQAADEIRQGINLIHAAECRLRTAFLTSNGWDFDVERQIENRSVPLAADEILKVFHREAWAHLVERMGLRTVLSVKRCEELDKQLATGKDLPEICEASILTMMQTNLANIGQYMEEAIREVYDALRPWRQDGYKTNSPYEVGRKVIRGYWVKYCVYSRKFSVNHEPKIRSLDNVFHMLDGKGTIKTCHGPLYEAIEQSGREGRGETDYFKFKCYRNNNLHLEFKRLDLLTRFNQIAGGAMLKPENKS